MANPNPPAPHAPVVTGPAALTPPPNSGFLLHMEIQLDSIYSYVFKFYAISDGYNPCHHVNVMF